MKPVTLLCLNFVTGIATRYARMAEWPHKLKALPEKAKIGEPGQPNEELATPEGRRMVESFRATGTI